MSFNFAAAVHDAVSAVAPLSSISIGRRDDKKTWQPHFEPTITDEQKQAALQVIATWDVNSALPADIKNEAQRRIIALTGQPTLQACMIKQLNSLMRATELTDMRVTGLTLTDEEAAEAEALRVFAANIKKIRAASNALEAQRPIPLDFTNDIYWPQTT